MVTESRQPLAMVRRGEQRNSIGVRDALGVRLHDVIIILRGKIPVLILAGVFLASCVRGGMAHPLLDAPRRPTPLHFGLHVTPDPDDNPIDPPERFSGYHVGLDYEVSEEELEEDVDVFAICSGMITYAGSADGYGGLVVQQCTLNGEEVSVLYGHVDTQDLPERRRTVSAGERIGKLAPARSAGSGGNRKHLHLGIHRGTEADYRGYVQTEEEVEQFVNPHAVLPQFPGISSLPKMVPYWEEDSE